VRSLLLLLRTIFGRELHGDPIESVLQEIIHERLVRGGMHERRAEVRAAIEDKQEGAGPVGHQALLESQEIDNIFGVVD
jgi:hypothetical protein